MGLTSAVKQEILMSDVTNCVTSLKKVVQDLRASGSADGQLQMANPVARYAYMPCSCHHPSLTWT